MVSIKFMSLYYLVRIGLAITNLLLFHEDLNTKSNGK